MLPLHATTSQVSRLAILSVQFLQVNGPNRTGKPHSQGQDWVGDTTLLSSPPMRGSATSIC